MSFSTYSSFMQPKSPSGEDNRRKISAYGSIQDSPNNSPQGPFAFGPNPMYSSVPRNAASLSSILNPSLALRTFGMGTDVRLPLGQDIFNRFQNRY
jgi:hypothetical protein